jgi:subtilisin family serine protease
MLGNSGYKFVTHWVMVKPFKSDGQVRSGKLQVQTAILRIPAQSWLRYRAPDVDGCWVRAAGSDRTLQFRQISGDIVQRNKTSALASFKFSVSEVDPIRLGKKLSGSLTRQDNLNPLRKGHFADDYRLKGFQQDRHISISLRSVKFDTYLQIIDEQTGKIVARNDDAGSQNTNSRVPFVAKAGVTYRIRVTSYKAREKGTYTLIATSNPFDRDYGYGLVDAAAAVAQSIRQDPFKPMSDLGGDRWNLDLINAPEAWANGYTGRGIVVAVLDTGVDYTHPDLAKNIWLNADEIPNNGLDDDQNGFVDDSRGWNFVDGGNNDPMDVDAHGTHVAGAIAATHNTFGVTGVAYDAQIMPIRVIGGKDDYSLTQFDANVAAGIRYAVQNGANVINMSLGNNPGDPAMPKTLAALKFARRAGVIAVMASGNEKENGAMLPIDPALYSRRNLGIAVGAINRNQTIAEFSNPAGNRPMDFFVAPGVNIRSTVPDGRYERLDWSGTSMATPHVAGVIALMLSANPNLTPDRVEQILRKTAHSEKLKLP